jgi:hypothetical protein
MRAIMFMALGCVFADAAPSPTPLPSLPDLSFGPAFGDDMVLQQQPAKAAVYGFLGVGATSASVSVSSGGKVLYTVQAALNVTKQPFGADWGTRPNAGGQPFNPVSLLKSTNFLLHCVWTLHLVTSCSYLSTILSLTTVWCTSDPILF